MPITNNAAMRQLLRELQGSTHTKKQEVFIINGAPGSGKTTYVNEVKRPGDIVMDLDRLAAAIQGESNEHPSYEYVMDVALAVREAMYRAIENREGKWNRAFVITSSADNNLVEDLAVRLDGEVIRMQTSKSECIERIKADETREYPERDIGLVESWFGREY